ncbi:hypothetical protein PUN28_015148 [Cardiocondyla obscurior]|uniref:Secreted protein n=1 Tax=Cardiocondyla obscurior TaxID=286306 RepID=A0AAW2EZS4_9HYME
MNLFHWMWSGVTCSPRFRFGVFVARSTIADSSDTLSHGGHTSLYLIVLIPSAEGGSGEIGSINAEKEEARDVTCPKDFMPRSLMRRAMRYRIFPAAPHLLRRPNNEKRSLHLYIDNC